jgi:hypothetical protein
LISLAAATTVAAVPKSQNKEEDEDITEYQFQ